MVLAAAVHSLSNVMG